MSAPLDDLTTTEAALLRACDYLGITGQHLDQLNTEADRMPSRKPSCMRSAASS